LPATLPIAGERRRAGNVGKPVQGERQHRTLSRPWQQTGGLL